MKKAVWLCFVSACSACVCLGQLAPEPAARITSAPQVWGTNVLSPALALHAAPPVVVPLAPLSPRTNLYVLTNAPGVPFYGLPGQPLFRSDKRLNANRLLAQNQPAPGLYKSEPYTCLVLVPGAHPDDQALVTPAPVSPRMPQTAPDLQLVPRSTQPKN